jgi:hypothetical protein
MIKQEILDFFRLETIGLIRDLEKTAVRMKECGITEFPESDLKDFAQKIDRVMGAAKSLEAVSPGNSGLRLIGLLSEALKTVGYQAAALQRASLAPFFAEFCSEAIGLIAKLVDTLQDEAATTKLVEDNAPKLMSRIKWLKERAAPADDEERKKVSELLKRL